MNTVDALREQAEDLLRDAIRNPEIANVAVAVAALARYVTKAGDAQPHHADGPVVSEVQSLNDLRLAVWTAFGKANGADPAGYVPVNLALNALIDAAKEKGRREEREAWLNDPKRRKPK